MKAIPFLTLFALSLPLAAQEKSDSKTAPMTGGSQESTPAGKPAPELLPHQKAFLNLPEERRNEFIKGLSESLRLFQQKRVFETLDELAKVSKIFEDSPEVYNLRGMCFMEMRAFEKALVEFKKAQALTKDYSAYEFNIAEVYFCTKEWKKSLDYLEKVLKLSAESDITFTRLVEFKILLCQKKLGMDEQAKKLADKYDFQDDSPFYYYAQAAMAYEKKDTLKAEEWLAMASRIFQAPGALESWQDTMIEYGYIKSFYGDEKAAAEK